MTKVKIIPSRTRSTLNKILDPIPYLDPTNNRRIVITPWIVIPARLDSTRLPQKLTLLIGSQPILMHTLKQALKTRNVQGVLVVTDSPLLADIAEGAGVSAYLSGPAESGTERIAAMHSVTNGAAVINLQADEPFISPTDIEQVSIALQKGAEMVSGYHRLSTREQVLDPNLVKVVLNHNSEAMYFSRAAIPHLRTGFQAEEYWGHIGVYGYSNTVLSSWRELPHSPLAEAEGLEQLRALQAGITIKMVEMSSSIGIDTPADLEKARAIYARNQAQWSTT